MASKWKYKPLKQKDEKEEEETLLIDGRGTRFGQFGGDHFVSSNHFRQPNNPNDHFNLPVNHHPNNHPNNHQTNQRNPFNNLENHHDLSTVNDPKYELKQRGNNNGAAARPQATNKDDAIELVEYCIKPNDSLLSISLSCNCSVEELKRVNRLINDREFYGLRFIKIPVRKYGLLSEVLIHQLNKTSQPISLEEIKASLTNQQGTSVHHGLTSDPTNLNRNLSSQNLSALNHHKLSSSRSANNLLASSLADGSSQPIGQQQPLINFNDEAYPPANQTANQTVAGHPASSNLPNSSAFSPDSLLTLQSPESNAASSRSSSTNSLIVNVGLKKTFDYDRTDCDLNKFLTSLDQDLDKMRQLTTGTPAIVEPLTSEDLLILNSQPDAGKSGDCDGASCGLTSRSVFLIAIFIFVLAPLIYFAIYAENESLNHLNHHLNHH